MERYITDQMLYECWLHGQEAWERIRDAVFFHRGQSRYADWKFWAMSTALDYGEDEDFAFHLALYADDMYKTWMEHAA